MHKESDYEYVRKQMQALRNPAKSKALDVVKDSARAREIKEKNESSRKSGLAITAKERHARRHEGKKGTSLSEFRAHARQMSKE